MYDLGLGTTGNHRNDVDIFSKQVGVDMSSNAVSILCCTGLMCYLKKKNVVLLFEISRFG